MTQRTISNPSILRRNLSRGTIDGIAFMLMVSFGETYFGAFVLALGHEPVYAGWIATIPLIMGAILQLVSLKGVKLIGSHKRWVIGCVVLQGLSFLPLLAVINLGITSIWVPFMAATIYWGAGMATGPAWNAWSESLIPRRLRTGYFTFRIRATQMAALVGLLISGFLLQSFHRFDRTLTGFGLLFLMALLCRCVSAYFLSQQSAAVVPDSNDNRPLGTVVREFCRGRSSRLLIYLMAVQFSAHVAAPFFGPYMLSKLKLPYTSFMLLLSVASVGRILILPFAGRLANRVGFARVILIAGIMVVPLPMFWLVSDDLAYLVVLQVMGGVAWATFELATFLHWFEAIPQAERTKTLTIYNLMNASAIVAGSLVGGHLLRTGVGEFSGYAAIFSTSSALRLGTLGLFFWAFREVLADGHRSPVTGVGLRTFGNVEGPAEYNRRGANRHAK